MFHYKNIVCPYSEILSEPAFSRQGFFSSGHGRKVLQVLGSTDLRLISLGGHGRVSAALTAFSKHSQGQGLTICLWYPQFLPDKNCQKYTRAQIRTLTPSQDMDT